MKIVIMLQPTSQPETASRADSVLSHPALPYSVVVDKQNAPRLDEFVLAALWIVGSSFWGAVGITSYVQNLASKSFSPAGFAVAYFFICLTAFGLRYAGHVALLLIDTVWKPRSTLRDNAPSFVYGVFIGCGAFFSLMSIAAVLAHTLDRSPTDTSIAPWVGIVSIGLMLAVGFGCIIASVSAFEPYLAAVRPRRNPATTSENTVWRTFNATGPLVREHDGRSRIERGAENTTLTLRNAPQIGTLGFLADGELFAASAGATIRFAAGGRKGRVVPPAFAFWQRSADALQTAHLESPQTFLTRNYRVPQTFDTTHFLVPSGGERFAWIGLDSIRVGAWQGGSAQNLHLETPVVPPQHGFAPFAFSPDGSRLAWADTSGQMRCWNVTTNRTHPLRAFPGEPWGLLFSADNLKVAAVGNTGVLLQNVLNGWRWFMACDPKETTPSALAIGPSGYHIALALRLKTAPHRVRVVDLYASRYVDLPAEHAIIHLTFSPDNHYLAAIAEGGTLHVWDLRPAHALIEALSSSKYDHLAPENAIHAAPSGLTPQRVLGPDLEQVNLSPDNQQPCVTRDLGTGDQPVVLTFTPDSSGLAAAYGTKVRLWDVAALCGA